QRQSIRDLAEPRVRHLLEVEPEFLDAPDVLDELIAVAIESAAKELERKAAEEHERQEFIAWARQAAAELAAEHARAEREQATVANWRADRIDQVAFAIEVELGFWAAPPVMDA